MKKTMAVLIVMGLGLTACSNDPRNGDAAKDALVIAENFAKSIACSTTFENDVEPEAKTTLKDVVLTHQDKENGEVSYYVLWSGDVGCNGGSGSYGSHVIEVSRFRDVEPLLVRDDQPLANLPISMRFIDSISSQAQNSLEIVAWAYADGLYGGADGGNNFPANKFRYQISRIDAYSPWKIDHQKLLEQRK